MRKNQISIHIPVTENKRSDHERLARKPRLKQEEASTNFYLPAHREQAPVYTEKIREKNTDLEPWLPQQERTRRRKWPHVNYKLIAVIGSAIALGILMGMMVLTIFSNLDSSSSSVNASGQARGSDQQEEQSLAAAEDLTDQSEIPADETSIHLALPSRSYHVVQAGVFSDRQKAENARDEYKQKGWPGVVMEQQESFPLFLSFSLSKEEAMLLGRFYQKEGVDIYVKEHVTKEVRETSVLLNEETVVLLPSVIDRAEQLAARLGKISSQAISESEYQLADQEWQQLQEEHRIFLEESKQLLGLWGEVQGKEEMEQIVQDLNKAVDALETYRQQDHQQYLWAIQDGLVHYLLHYERWLSILAA